jgi:hypothetical protein
MIELKLNARQASFLEAALEKAMDNEGDAEYYEAYNELSELLNTAKETV